MRIASSSLRVPRCIGIGGVFRRLETHLDMALGREIVDLAGLRFLDDADDVRRIRHVAIVQEERRRTFMRIDIEMVDALGVEGRGAPLHAVNDIALLPEGTRQGSCRPGR